MTPFIVIVEFTVSAAEISLFVPLMLANAGASLEREEGCERFDVLRPDGTDDRVLLYEIYRDRAAFDAHGTSAHYIAFAEATKAMVRAKSVTFCSIVDANPSVVQT